MPDRRWGGMHPPHRPPRSATAFWSGLEHVFTDRWFRGIMSTQLTWERLTIITVAYCMTYVQSNFLSSQSISVHLKCFSEIPYRNIKRGNKFGRTWNILIKLDNALSYNVIIVLYSSAGIGINVNYRFNGDTKVRCSGNLFFAWFEVSAISVVHWSLQLLYAMQTNQFAVSQFSVWGNIPSSVTENMVYIIAVNVVIKICCSFVDQCVSWLPVSKLTDEWSHNSLSANCPFTVTDSTRAN